jgi:isoamylase
MKNMLATLLLSQGTPMLLAGDEFARTQKGNNNAYGQDNDISWLDWSHSERQEHLIGFTRSLIELRHQFPILRRVRWLTGKYDEELEVSDVTWLGTGGEPLRDEQWTDEGMKCFGMLLDGRAPETGIRRRGEMATLLVIFNAWQDAVPFKLPEATGGNNWTLLMDTNLPDHPEQVRFEFGHEYAVTGRSMLMLQLT